MRLLNSKYMTNKKGESTEIGAGVCRGVRRDNKDFKNL